VALDILQAIPSDSGTYTCTVSNPAGTAKSSFVINITPKENLLTATQHEGAIEKLKALEDRKKRKPETVEECFAEAPKFVRPLRNVNVVENGLVHLEASLIPVNDPDLRVEWISGASGAPLKNGE